MFLLGIFLGFSFGFFIGASMASNDERRGE